MSGDPWARDQRGTNTGRHGHVDARHGDALPGPAGGGRSSAARWHLVGGPASAASMAQRSTPPPADRDVDAERHRVDPRRCWARRRYRCGGGLDRAIRLRAMSRGCDVRGERARPRIVAACAVLGGRERPLLRPDAAAGTYHIPIPTEEILAFTVVGDGTGTATFTVQWCDFALTWTAPRSIRRSREMRGSGSPTRPLSALTIAASSTVTGGKRVSLSNAAARGPDCARRRTAGAVRHQLERISLTWAQSARTAGRSLIAGRLPDREGRDPVQPGWSPTGGSAVA